MKVRWRWGTAARLATFVAVMLAVVIAVALLALLRTFRAQSDAATTRSLVVEVQSFAAAAGARPPAQTLEAFTNSYLQTHVLPDGEYVAVALSDGRLIGSVGSQPLLSAPAVQGWAGAVPTVGTRRQLSVAGAPYLVTAVPLVEQGHTLATVIAAANLNQAHKDLGRVRDLAVGEAVIALLAAVAGCYLMLRRLVDRIGRITSTASNIASGALETRLREPNRRDEVGRLAATFDAMADRLQAAMSGQRRLLSDVSHQLRTPLTVARGHLEVLERTGADDPDDVRATVALVVDEIDHMKALVEQLLMLGHALEPDFLSLEPVDLRSFCTDLMDAAHVIAPRRWECESVPDVVLHVDAAKLRGALLNLIDNAVHATVAGDVVALSVDRSPDGSIALSVDDSGPGIPVEQRAVVLERFARLGAADSEGSGLGLAIVSAVAQAHGGDLTIADSAYGGCRITITLPAVTTVDVADPMVEVMT
jgi:two-component system OmpR family sensor kinase